MRPTQNLIGGKLQPAMPGRTFDLVDPTTGIDQIRSFASAARVLEGLSAGECMRGRTSMIRREPIGVCAQVTPWNSPMMMAIWKWCRAIAAGNTIEADHGPLNDVNQHDRVKGPLEGRPDHVEVVAGGSSMVRDSHSPIVVEMPPGGFKHSGHGKALSMYSLGDHTRIEHAMSNIEA